MRAALRTLTVAILLALAPAAASAARSSIVATGTVLHLGPAADAWGIQADDGALYEPVNLGKKFCRDGLRVSFRAKPEGRHRAAAAGARAVRITRIALLPDSVPLPREPRTTPPRIPPSR